MTTHPSLPGDHMAHGRIDTRAFSPRAVAGSRGELREAAPKIYWKAGDGSSSVVVSL